MINTIITIIIVVFVLMIAFAVVKKLVKMALTILIVGLLLFGAAGFMIKTDYDNLSEKFNDMDTLILLQEEGEYIQALEKMKPIDASTVDSESFVRYERVIVIKENMDLEKEFNGTSKENLDKIIKLKKDEKAEVMPETMFFRVSDIVAK